MPTRDNCYMLAIGELTLLLTGFIKMARELSTSSSPAESEAWTRASVAASDAVARIMKRLADNLEHGDPRPKGEE